MTKDQFKQMLTSRKFKGYYTDRISGEKYTRTIQFFESTIDIDDKYKLNYTIESMSNDWRIITSGAPITDLDDVIAHYIEDGARKKIVLHERIGGAIMWGHLYETYPTDILAGS